MNELEQISKLMEEMANAPKEDFGKRQPGEKCMYELESRKRYEEQKDEERTISRESN